MSRGSAVRKIAASSGVTAESGTDKFHVIFDQASDAVLIATDAGRIDEVNVAFTEMTGYVADVLKGRSLEDLVPDPTVHRVPNRAKPFSAELAKTPGTFEDVAIRRQDGYVRLADVSVRTVRKGRHSLAVMLFRDVTEKKLLERELITKHAELRNAYVQLEKNNIELKSMQETLVQAGKMAALGELSAGIAHELNQPLQAIRGYAQELQGMSGLHGDGASHLVEIVSGADKMASIIQYLRNFTGKSVEKHEFNDVHQIIEEALKMLARQFTTRGIEVEKSFNPHLPTVYANALQLEQVFINLATNARDAIEAAGRGRGKLKISTRDAGSFVEIEFQDDGVGMNERTKAKAFNPFFTTKEVGKGMGIGLSLSYGILNRIHGSMVVESELGKGTTFIVKVPVDFREIA